ncbi:MAG: hypothetical protein IT182_09665 [Acidobacteria bacterium]|nr:hypothetical protein [Acidobacteriota bacterium]
MDQVGLVEMVGAAAFFGYLIWAFIFMQFLRDRIMQRIGRALGTTVAESYGQDDAAGLIMANNTAGLYEGDPDAPVTARVGVAIADFVVLVLGIMGPFTMLGLCGYYLGDSGLLFRWEGMVTGTSVRIVSLEPAEMRNGTGEISVVIANQGTVTALQCRAGKADYTSADGYTNASSKDTLFDLAPGDSRTTILTLHSPRPVPGTHRLRIEVECRYRTKDQVSTTLHVVD